MPRLIDADAFLEYCKPYPHVYQVMRSVLKQLPIVDAVPVIRCRDCKFWLKTKKQCGYTYLLPHFEAGEFCSRAERKNNG